SLARAREFCAINAGRAILIPENFDRDRDALSQIAAFAPELVVDASGPFQQLGSRAYAVVEACISLGVAYLDLADASGFVQGIAQFDQAARARGLFVLSGASTLPALSTAVAVHLAEG